MTAALECRGVTMRFGAFTALSDVSLTFESGLLYGVIGPNGAGKTTLINALSGRLPVTSGQVLLNGRDVTRQADFVRVKHGLGRSFQITKLFTGLTVFETLRLAGLSRHFRVQPFWRPIGTYAAPARSADDMLGFIGLGDKRDIIAEHLSHGDQRALEVGMTLMTDPRVVLLDEPLAGVGQNEIERAITLIERVKQDRSVILVEHNMSAVMRLSDHVVVMTRGSVLASGTPAEVQANPAVRTAYLGEEHHARA